MIVKGQLKFAQKIIYSFWNKIVRKILIVESSK